MARRPFLSSSENCRWFTFRDSSTRLTALQASGHWDVWEITDVEIAVHLKGRKHTICRMTFTLNLDGELASLLLKKGAKYLVTSFKRFLLASLDECNQMRSLKVAFDDVVCDVLLGRHFEWKFLKRERALNKQSTRVYPVHCQYCRQW